MKIIISTTVIAILLSLVNLANTKKEYYKNGKLKYEYSIEKGVLNGVFSSYHSNGNLKSKGGFANNQRIGSFQLWDSTGLLKLERFYENNNKFKEGTNNLEYDNESKLENNNVLWSKRIWKTISIYDINLSNDMEKELETNKSLMIYEDDEFKNLSQNKNTSFDSIVLFKVKEDWFFDKLQNRMRRAVVAICPVSSINNTTYDIGWMYFPSFLSSLSQSQDSLKTLIKGVSANSYPSVLFKESNFNDKNLSEYVEEGSILQESNKIIMELMEEELNQLLVIE
jgi:hypothetical protein